MNAQKFLTLTLLTLTLTAPAFAQEQRQGPPHGRGPQLTDAQRTCLDGILGKPGEGERPSHETMDAAMTKCGVSKPARPADSSSSSEGGAQ